MSPIQFKFTKPPDGLVRRVTFQDRPSWNELAAKIESLYNIPVQSIGVSYVDTDGDEVTLSSEEELQDFYQSAAMQRKDREPLILVKFTVRDLDALRSDKPLPETPRTTSDLNYRNTFGRSVPVLFEMEVDDGWQPIPSGLAGLFAGPVPPAPADSPHAFVEVLDSDADISQSQDKDKARTSTFTESSLPEINPSPTTDKGKGRARTEDFQSDSDTISSNRSVVGEETGSKHPIHVFNVNRRKSDDIFGVTRSRSRSGTATAPRTPPPKSKTPTGAANQPASGAPDDPPLPDLENMSSPPTNIAHDVANLFSTLSNILASHPELSEGIRNIVRNASNGTYWQAHRDSVVRAAEEMRRSALVSAEELRQAATDSRRSAEEAAGRRVADALGNVIRVIADITGNPAAGAHARGAAGAGNDPATSTPIAERDPSGAHSRWNDPWLSGFGAHRGRGAFGGRGRGGHAHMRGRHGSVGSWGTFGSRWGEWGDMGPRGQHPFARFPPPPGPPPAHNRPERAAGPPPPPGPPPAGVPPPPPPPHHGPHGIAGIFDPPADSPVQGPPPHHHHHHPPHGHGHFGPPPFGRHHHMHSEGEWSGRDPFSMRSPPFGWPHHIPPVDADWADTVPSLPPPPPPPPPPAPTANANMQAAEVTMYGASPVESPDAAKKALQDAKERYLAEKERYRRIREERKKRRMNVSTDSEMRDVQDSPVSVNNVPEPSVRPAAAEPSTMQRRTTIDGEAQIISNARGPFPQLELYSVPRRSHTIHGTGHARDASFSTDANSAAIARAVDSITRRLNDMGFTLSQYPALSSKVEARVSRSGEVSQEREDNIVGEIVEELVQTSPRPQEAQPSGSGSRAT
ncbi:hypothetical protein BV20DRAFT_1009367 [Pilatotrama ljubarskyi]|nr:hypothetical protein BV20DRAFT_1009367 [Pilatotrama ljubarskyi]